ncbi:MAG: DUF2085 domain-containing protein [Deltaproteobacteria bacterium]|nr:DUF2085 domain-containing protein [Deltaproteobacteria bacterium]
MRVGHDERERQRVGRELLFWARVSFVLFGSLPWWLPLARRYLPLGPLGLILDYLFIVVCHRLPERTLVIASVPMPVCSRCGGIITGLGLGALVAWPRPTVRQTRVAVLVAGLAMLADVLMQELGAHPLWHTTRLLTGGALGYVLTCALVAAIRRDRAATVPR